MIFTSSLSLFLCASFCQNFYAPISEASRTPVELYIQNSSSWNLTVNFYETDKEDKQTKTIFAGTTEPLGFTNKIAPNISFQAQPLLGINLYQEHKVDLTEDPYNARLRELFSNSDEKLKKAQLILEIATGSMQQAFSWKISLLPIYYTAPNSNNFLVKESAQAASSSGSESYREPHESDLIKLNGIDDLLKVLHQTREALEHQHKKDIKYFDPENRQKLSKIYAQLRDMFLAAASMKKQETMRRGTAVTNLMTQYRNWIGLVGTEQNAVTNALVKLADALKNIEPAIEQ